MINTIILGHALDILPKLPPESVNCVVCSPPFWSLRDYGIEPVIWDGDKDCEHEWETNIREKEEFKGSGTGWLKSEKVISRSEHPEYWEKKKINSAFCLKCSAWRGSLGLEPTFELYIKHLCDIFDEVKRVLRKDGTCWVNLGDSYNGSKVGNTNASTGAIGKPKYSGDFTKTFKKENQKNVPTKSLCLIPQRFVIEMVNRGWILRNTIIWHKPNCMPSSAKDRFTVDFEYVYFFVKNKKYWFGQQFEEYAPDTLPRMDRGVNVNKWTLGANGQTPHNLSQPRLNKKRGYKTKQPEEEIHRPQHHGKDISYGRQGRNKRCVWAIPTKSFPEAHFAVYPETLIEPMIKAGCPEFICKKCGKARIKMIVSESKPTRPGKRSKDKNNNIYSANRKRYMPEYKGEFYTDCGCNAGFESGIVLDPFMGSGTTALVALKQRKGFIGIEIKKEYIDMSYKRIARVQQRIF